MLHNRLWVSVLAIGTLACTLTGCSPEENPTQQTPTTSAVTSTTSAESTTSSTPATSTTETSTSSAKKTGMEEKSVKEAYDLFQSLAPKSLFEQLESCMPGGVDKSMQCSGTEVGQFQFFESENKAVTTTQLLTELDSSRIVERDDDKLIGWSSLGSTAVITVVDTKRGLVMQQMMSADKQEPKDRIIELGLLKNQEQVETSEPSE
ncbi:hypothetical protein [Corynebacterium freiburgense]|uniref:hypothetical protein n=1 Tax=Corynebacterium freiburgense TaxID=556548 RepID=UPI0003F6AFF3|nr:hypothetical protein [Corynebacterium freiburgense]WJZ01955.1 hypothetical protein CFREI_03255 [Corynebacterium freiburgense]